MSVERRLQVLPELLVQIPLEPVSAEQRAKSGVHAARNAEHQASPSVARMIFVIAAV
jgi:hypothetical protein